MKNTSLLLGCKYCTTAAALDFKVFVISKLTIWLVIKPVHEPHEKNGEQTLQSLSFLSLCL